MAKFNEDMIFKNVVEEDARLFLDILGKKSDHVKIITKEIIQKDPRTFRPDIILELDQEILIIELQSTPVKPRHHKRFNVYVAIATYNNKTKKQVKLCVFTTAEKSRKVTFPINDDNCFRYDIISLSEYDSAEIINTIKYKKENNIEISNKELVLYALVPLIEKSGNVEKYIDKVVHTLIKLDEFDESIQSLAYGIEWLIVDKFIEDDTKRNILCDLLGDKMSLIDEYAKNREIRAENNLIVKMLEHGAPPKVISNMTEISIERINSLKEKYHL